MSDPYLDEPGTLSGRLVAYYRGQQAAHEHDPVTDECRICNASGCEDARFARERLLFAGERLSLPAGATEVPSSTSDNVP
jgi:hypothetical protein